MNPLDSYRLVLAALCIWREARNQSYSAMLGVAFVLYNRITPTHDLIHVITQRMQFSSMTAAGDTNLILWPQTGDAAFGACCTAVETVLGGEEITVPDPTNGATFYYSPPLTAAPAAWGPTVVSAVIDQLTFCKPSSPT